MTKIEDLNMDEKLEDGSPRYRRLANDSIYDNTLHHIVARELTSEGGANW